jgi:SAM-dependent methyltransferase
VSGLAPNPIGVEALDDHTTEPEVVRATLADIVRSNRWFGGRAAVARGVDRLSATLARPITVLDVGAGAGDIVGYLADQVARRGGRLTPIAVERHPEAARLCRARGVATVLADGGFLPMGAGSVDIVVASQLLHHLERAAAIQVARELDRVARIGVVIADLRRSATAELGIWLASYLMAFHPVSRHDGVLSVRRGFTAPELAGLLADAGVVAHVERRPQFRLLATWRSDRAGR